MTAFEAVEAAIHPDECDGGPCHDCAFRKGSVANGTLHTRMLAQACVDGLVPFYCHINPGLCRGFVAAVNLVGAPETEDEKRQCEAAKMLADVLALAIAAAKEADESNIENKK